MSNDNLETIDSYAQVAQEIVSDIQILINTQFEEDLNSLELVTNFGADRMNAVGVIDKANRAIKNRLNEMRIAVKQAITASGRIEVKNE